MSSRTTSSFPANKLSNLTRPLKSIAVTAMYYLVAAAIAEMASAVPSSAGGEYLASAAV